MQIYNLSKIPATTQKASGIKSLIGRGMEEPVFLCAPEGRGLKYGCPSHTFGAVAQQIPKIFARPCPITPQHGFVDSRIVSSLPELLSLWKETRRVDPEGEIILMRYIESRNSAVVDSEGGIVLGTGNDGVTAGKGKTLVLSGDYLCGHEGPFLPENTVQEMVQEGNKWWPVQLRAVPKLPSVEVAAYLQKGRKLDLNKRSVSIINESWYNLVELLSSKDPNEEFVLVHNLRSHLACLAIERGFDVVPFSKIAEIRNANGVIPTLHPKGTPKQFRNQVRQGIQYGFYTSLDITTCNAAAKLASQAAKSYIVKGMPGFQMGVGIALLFRLVAAACMAELRYGFHHPLIYRIFGKYDPIWMRIYREHIRNPHLEVSLLTRIPYYTATFNLTITRTLSILLYCDMIFNKRGWGTSVGGKKWGELAHQASLQYEAVHAFITNPTVSNYKEMGAQSNLLSSLVHNGGVGPLTKFAHYRNENCSGLNLFTQKVSVKSPPKPRRDLRLKKQKKRYITTLPKVYRRICGILTQHEGREREMLGVDCKILVCHTGGVVNSMYGYITDSRFSSVFNNPRGFHVWMQEPKGLNQLFTETKLITTCDVVSVAKLLYEKGNIPYMYLRLWAPNGEILTLKVRVQVKYNQQLLEAVPIALKGIGE